MPAQTVIKLRRDTAANWTSVDPVLAAGEPGYETDSKKLKFGDGVTAWTALPYTESEVTDVEFIEFITTAGYTVGVGELAWNADQETLDLGLDEDVTLQIGQEHVVRVKNASNTTAIPNGTLVMFAGAAGDTVTVAPAVTDGSVPAEYMLGITTEDIPAEDFGFVTQFGFLQGVDTSAFNVGDILYGDPAVAGGLTATKPAAPNLKLPIAAVTLSNANAGRMLVRMTNGLKLDELHNVSLNGTSAGEFLKYDGTKWVAEAIDLSSKQDVITGAATTITSDNLTASRAVVSDGSGKVAASSVTSTEVGHLSGVTSGIQGQLDSKQATITGGATTIITSNLTASRAVVSDGSGKVAVSAVTSTELGHVAGVTSAIQTQLNARVNTVNGAVTTAATGSTVVRNITLSTSDPSGGTDGQVWLKYT